MCVIGFYSFCFVLFFPAVSSDRQTPRFVMTSNRRRRWHWPRFRHAFILLVILFSVAYILLSAAKGADDIQLPLWTSSDSNPPRPLQSPTECDMQLRPAITTTKKMSSHWVCKFYNRALKNTELKVREKECMNNECLCAGSYV